MVDPKPVEVRAWAYRPEFYFIEQDEGLLLGQRRYFPVLVELLNDDDCPKQMDISKMLKNALRESVLFHRWQDARALHRSLERTDRAHAEPNPLVNELRDYCAPLILYIDIPFAVDRTRALRMAEDLMRPIGKTRPLEIRRRFDSFLLRGPSTRARIPPISLYPPRDRRVPLAVRFARRGCGNAGGGARKARPQQNPARRPTLSGGGAMSLPRPVPIRTSLLLMRS